MLRSDARTQEEGPSAVINNLDSLDISTISKIQKDIDYYDMISLVFLLYDVPDTALQRLIIYQRVSKDIDSSSSNLLHEWACHVQNQPTWREKFLEALVICQLYSIVRKMGLDVYTIKRKYQCTNENVSLIHPMKKTLYKLCENMKSDNLYKLKKTLLTYDIDVTDYEYCELVLLGLMCRKFITLKTSSCQLETKNDPGIENLAKIINNFPELISIADDFRRIEQTLSGKDKINSPPITSTPTMPLKDRSEKDKKYDLNEFKDVFALFEDLKINKDDPTINFKSDTIFINKPMYPIKNPQNVGVCLIINQETFHPSKESIEFRVKPLDDRLGSRKDKEKLKQTMANLNFEVVTRDNLDHTEMIKIISDVIKYRVSNEHSMFVLCILSHGTRGHVYAADSVKVKVEHIESLLDTDDAAHLRGKPKLLIMQACQVDDDEPSLQLVADSPEFGNKSLKKSDVIVFWATAPTYEAYRHEKMGSIFIQILCETITQCSGTEQVLDIFTSVIRYVKKLCTWLKCEQLPKVELTLDKKLYLQLPKK